MAARISHIPDDDMKRNDMKFSYDGDTQDKFKPILVTYYNIGQLAEKVVSERLAIMRKDLKSIKGCHVIILPVRNQETKMELLTIEKPSKISFAELKKILKNYDEDANEDEGEDEGEDGPDGWRDLV